MTGPQSAGNPDLKPASVIASGLCNFPSPVGYPALVSTKHPDPLLGSESPAVPLDHPEFQTWSDGSPVLDSIEFDPSLQEEVSVDDGLEGDTRPLQLETKGASRQKQQGKAVCGELWKSQTVFKNSVAAKLREAGQTEDANTLEECHSRRVFAQCNGCQSVKVFRNRCDNFFCPECQPKLARKRAAGVAWWTQQINQPKHVVLTVRNIPDLTKGHVVELKKWFTKLRHRKFCANWKGGFYSVEATNEGKGWHIHLHVLVDARWIDSFRLAEEWRAVTGGFGHIVKVKDCRGTSYLREVTKYAATGPELSAWSKEEIVTFITAFRGTKTFGVFGTLYGKRTEFSEWIKSLSTDGKTCQCGCATSRFYDEQEWLARDLIPCPTTTAPPKKEDAYFDFGQTMVATRSILQAFRR